MKQVLVVKDNEVSDILWDEVNVEKTRRLHDETHVVLVHKSSSWTVDAIGCRIGRGKALGIKRDENGVLLIEIDDSEISKKHALVRRGKDGRWRIKDLKSLNGTAVNQVGVTQDQELKVGDTILVGRSKLHVQTCSQCKKCVEECPICGELLTRFSRPFRKRHIDRCQEMKKQERKTRSRPQKQMQIHQLLSKKVSGSVDQIEKRIEHIDQRIMQFQAYRAKLVEYLEEAKSSGEKEEVVFVRTENIALEPSSSSSSSSSSSNVQTGGKLWDITNQYNNFFEENKKKRVVEPKPVAVEETRPPISQRQQAQDRHGRIMTAVLKTTINQGTVSPDAILATLQSYHGISMNEQQIVKLLKAQGILLER